MPTTNRLPYLLPLLAFLALPSATSSQVSFGVSGGVAISGVTGDDLDDTDTRTGALAGAFLTFPVGGIISLTTGAYYVQKGATWFDGRREAEVDYLEVPLLVNVEVFGGERASFSLFAGGQVSFETTCDGRASSDFTTVSGDCDDLDGIHEIENTQYGAIFGGGVRFMTSDSMFFLVNGGLDLGLSDVFDSDRRGQDSTWFGWFAQAGVGWSFPPRL